MTRTALILAAVGMMLPAATATAQELLTNGDFETADPDLPFLPLGWGDIPQDVPIWTDEFAHTGLMSVSVPAPTFTSFVGWTTNIFDVNTELYDPAYEYGGGDYIVSGYYMIPANDPLAPETETRPYDNCGIKLEFRRVPPNFSIYQSFEYLIGDVITTNDEWVYFEIVVPPDQISPDFPPYPGSCTIVPFRFRFGGTPTPQGTIYWDDLSVTQVGGQQFCIADVNTTNTNPGDPGYGEPDGTVDGADLSYYVENWLNQVLAVADVNTTNTNPGDAGYGSPDGTVDGADLSYYVEQWLAGNAGAGCP